MNNFHKCLNEALGVDLASFLNSREVIPWTGAPHYGCNPRFSVRPGHENECVDEDCGLVDRSNQDVTEPFRKEFSIDTYIASWTPILKPKSKPIPHDTNLLDDTDEFYRESECVVHAILGWKYGPDSQEAVFYNGQWQNL